MIQPTEKTRTVVMERTFRHAPAKLWRALTESSLLAQWLLKNDFEPIPGKTFQFRNEPMPQWDGIIDCEVLVVEPQQKLSYTWRALGLDSVVTFTLTPAENGTHLRMEHSGFPTVQDQAFKGATYGWQRFLTNLDQLLEGEAA